MKKIVKKPMLLIVRDYEDPRYFLVNNDKELFKFALQVVEGRDEEDYYGCFEDFYGLEPEFNKEQAEKLPGDTLRKFALKTLSDYECGKETCQKEIEKLKAIKEIIKTKNGAAAWELLCEINKNDPYDDDAVNLEEFEKKY